MSADMKTLLSRIKSVEATLQLTKAMGLAASAKIRRASLSMQNANAHEKNLHDILLSAVSSCEISGNPLMRTGGDRTRLIVVSGDRGLAGGYNANIFRLAAQFPNAKVLPIGYRSCERFGKELVSAEHFRMNEAFETSEHLCKAFAENKYDKLGIICTRYISAMVQEAYIKWIFPLKTPEKAVSAATVFEPDANFVLNAAVYEYTAAAIFASVRESFACEVAARRTAMDSAEKNAQAMSEELQLKYNRARQGAITQEITEIIAGSGA